VDFWPQGRKVTCVPGLQPGFRIDFGVNRGQQQQQQQGDIVAGVVVAGIRRCEARLCTEMLLRESLLRESLLRELSLQRVVFLGVAVGHRCRQSLRSGCRGEHNCIHRSIQIVVGSCL
jgi:hypothetical protein